MSVVRGGQSLVVIRCVRGKWWSVMVAVAQPPHSNPKRARIRVPLFTKKGVNLERGARFAIFKKKGYFFGLKFAI